MSLQAQQSTQPDRLAPALVDYAQMLQRRGKTFREIAEMTHAPVKAVEQSLYWDRVQ